MEKADIVKYLSIAQDRLKHTNECSWYMTMRGGDCECDQEILKEAIQAAASLLGRSDANVTITQIDVVPSATKVIDLSHRTRDDMLHVMGEALDNASSEDVIMVTFEGQGIVVKQ